MSSVVVYVAMKMLFSVLIRLLRTWRNLKMLSDLRYISNVLRSSRKMTFGASWFLNHLLISIPIFVRSFGGVLSCPIGKR